MENDYSKREIDTFERNVNEKFADIKKQIEDVTNYQNKVLDAIRNTGMETEKKVSIQNGRVAKLEGKAMWLTGVGVTVTFLFGMIIGLVVYSFQLSQENLKQSILLEIQK